MMRRTRQQRRSDPGLNAGRLLVHDTTTGLDSYVNPGDEGYDEQLKDYNRRNNIPDDVNPPADNPEEEEEEEGHPPSSNRSEHSSNPDNSNDNDYNYDYNDDDPLLTIEDLEEKAAISYVRMTRKVDLDKGLRILHNQKGKINTKAEAFVALNFSEEEKREILHRYTSNPAQLREKQKADGAVQLVEGLIRLGEEINTKKVEAFQAMSDKFGNQHIDLAQLVDKHARYTLDVTFQSLKDWLQFSDEELNNWWDTWDHVKLAKVISTIWADKNATGTKNLMEQIKQFDFELNSDKMKLGREGMQRKITEFNALFLMHPTASYADPEFQKRVVKNLMKKFDKDSWEKTDIEASKLPQDTVKEFIVKWLSVRMHAWRCIEQCKRYGCIYEINTNSKNYKLLGKRPREGEAPEKNNSRDEKRQKSKEKDRFRSKVYVEKDHCTICGMNNHKRNSCFIERDKHPDRNTELEFWHNSTKGKQWMDGNKNGPFCSREYLLNGDKWTPSGAKSSSKYELMHLIILIKYIYPLLSMHLIILIIFLLIF